MAEDARTAVAVVVAAGCQSFPLVSSCLNKRGETRFFYRRPFVGSLCSYFSSFLCSPHHHLLGILLDLILKLFDALKPYIIMS
jgi:hypothetical protein